MKKYAPLVLNAVAILAIITLIATHLEYNGIQTIVYALIAITIGYHLGRWTCHLHQKQQGFWITIGVFVLLNLIHSMIDGASIGEVSSFAGGVAMLSHEMARQPALYIVLWGMLTPFISHRPTRLLIAPLAVTGVWMLGAYMGYGLFSHINETVWLEPIADMAVFLFLGDLIHHIREEYGKLKHKAACCHQH